MHFASLPPIAFPDPWEQALAQTATQGGGQAAAAAKAVAQAAQQSERSPPYPHVCSGAGMCADLNVGATGQLLPSSPMRLACPPRPADSHVDCTYTNAGCSTRSPRVPFLPFLVHPLRTDPDNTAAALSQALAQAQSSGNSQACFLRGTSH